MSDVNISSFNRLVYPNQKISKLDVAIYYNEIADFIMPFLNKRPLSVIRCHDDINGETFFKKHPSDSEDVERFKKNNEKLPYFYLKDKKQLISQVQFGTIELHIWANVANKLNSPDIMVFDLDPDEKLSLAKLRRAVELVKFALDGLHLKSFLKTSGGKGYHIVVPFKNVKSYTAFENFAKNFAICLEDVYPNIFTTNIRKENRKGKIFIDYLRNKKGSTCVCPYSLRLRDGAPISFPISWDSLSAIKPNQINLKNYKKYINNAWENFFEINQSLPT